jgi:type VI secretion system protein ImpA
MALCDGPTFIDRLRMVPIVSARTLGRFSLRDVAVATGELPPPAGTEAPKTAAIDGAFTECALPELQATADSVRSALGSLTALEAFVGEKMGVSMGPNFAPLTKVLQTADKLLALHLARRGAASGDPTAAPVEGGTAAAPGPGHGGGPSISGEINSREDVVRVLDKICLYYQRFEPSSPIPLLLQRSKRLVSASFMDIMRDLAPGGVAEVENLRGKDESQSS